MNGYIRFFGYYGWLLLLLFISLRRPAQVTRKEKVLDHTVTRYTWFFALIAVAPLVYLTAYRSRWFADTNMYWQGFLKSPASFSSIYSYATGVSKDNAFYFCVALIHTIIGNHPILYFTIVAALQMFAVVFVFRKYSTNLLLSLFVFVASTDYISYMHNGVRQFAAVCIILLASRFIFERKLIPAIIAVILASQFHQSALLMIPILFIIQGSPWNKSTVAMLFGALLVIIFVDQFTGILDTLLEETQYSNIVSDWTSWDDNGTNPLRVAVYSVPAVLSLVGLPYIREENDPMINICTNMSIISAGLYLISMATSGIFMGRLPIYVSLYANCILLPWEVDHIFSKESSIFIKSIMIVFFMIFYVYQVHNTWGLV